MRSRTIFGRFLIRLGSFIRSLAIMVMRPDDLVEFSRRFYSSPNSLAAWGAEDVLDMGLSPDELALLEKVPLKEGRLLLLGVGGGREAISLARMGFEVTGVDFVPKMVEKARESAAQRGVRIEPLVQEISRLEVSAGSYHIVWLSAAMYSCVPTRKRRIEMLKRIVSALISGGYFLCQFHWDTSSGFSRRIELARRAIAFFTLGNLCYEKGDTLRGNVEFIHAFSSEDTIRSEFEEGGFEVIYIHLPEGSMRGGAVLRRA